MGYLFMIASSFTLAKTIRDREDADRLEAIIVESKPSPKFNNI